MKQILRGLLILAGAMLGPGIVLLVYRMIVLFDGADVYVLLGSNWNALIFIASGILSGILFLFLSKKIMHALSNLVAALETKIDELPLKTVLSGVVSFVLGLLIAYLLSFIVNQIPIPWLSIPLNLILYVVFGYVAFRVGMKIGARMGGKPFRRIRKEKKVEPENAKILDTSVIIDGRIYGILKTGILEGTIVVPEFVLQELQNIADSADGLKRGKGRYGLDVLNRIQKELKIPVFIPDQDYEEISQVDAKLLRLAKDWGAKVITNDFNLNKVAEVQGVKILNINDLSNAVKSILLPGEELPVAILKAGKEPGQGIGYLEDGTMIVVENGGGNIGETKEVIVTSVLQTSAGRMIFGRMGETA